MSDERPNILLLMTDQQRGDALGIEGHPVLQTPYLDALAAAGARFRHAYSATPVCIPARRTLMAGQRAASHGVFMNYTAPLPGPTLPGELSKAGYQTHLVGKLHLSPPRKLYGFDSADWSDSPSPHPAYDDYERFLVESGVTTPGAGLAHGASVNGYTARPYHLDERFHFSNWCADRALSFLARRDPTMPFFLKVSFHQPHQPLTPPAAYWDRYRAMDIPPPPVADWSRVYETPQRGLPVNAWRVCLEPELQRQMQAGYYGCINHIDDQIGRILARIPPNTVILFVSDHGEMLGQHQWIRKRSGYEGSARIPFLLRAPARLDLGRGVVANAPVELMDVMPTLLDLAGVPIPEEVDGTSVLPILRGESTGRDFVRGECSRMETMNSGTQFLSDGRRKYIWYPGTGHEQFFDLESDPDEMVDLGSAHTETAIWRQRLVSILADRPEGFVEDGRLVRLTGPTAPCLPQWENASRHPI